MVINDLIHQIQSTMKAIKLKCLMLVALVWLLLTNAISVFSQTETHDFVTYDTTISIFTPPWGPTNTWMVRISRPRNLFTAGNPDTASRPAIITMPGEGQQGNSDTNNLVTYGPHYWLQNGWDGSVVLGNGKHYPIIITICYVNEVYNNVQDYYNVLDTLITHYHIKKNSVHMGGLSEGAFSEGALIEYEQTPGDQAGMKMVNSVTAFEGTPNPLPAYPNPLTDTVAYKIWAAKYHGRYFYLEGNGSDDFRDGWQYSTAMNDSVPGSAYFSYENLGGGAHCCWNSMYDPSQTNWTSVGTLGPYNAPSQLGTNTMGDYVAPENVFQWMLRQGDTTLVGSGTSVPVPVPAVSAGSNQAITLPTNSVTLTGTASETGGTIASYLWTKVSGGAATISTPATAGTTVTGLAAGTYVFKLLATDNSGDTASSTVQVVVNAAVKPVVSAGSAQTITLPTNSVTLSGSASETGGTIASYSWSEVSGGAATISTPSSASTAVSGLAAGTYVFELVATDNSGDTSISLVQVAVNGASTTPVTPPGSGTYITNVIVAEYRTWYVTNTGGIFAYNNASALPVQFPIGGSAYNGGVGGFNYFRVLDDSGYVWMSKIDYTTNTSRIMTDTTGAAFNGNWYIDAYGHVALTIRPDSSVWYFGIDAYSLFYPGGDLVTMTGVTMAPTQLSPAGMKFKKVLFGGNGIIGLTTTGQVYKWFAGGSRTPTLMTTPRPAIDVFISHLDVDGCIIPDPGETSGMGYPYIWGSTTSMYGGNTAYTEPTSIKALWNMTVPIKQISVDWNTIHYIDSLGNMYGTGFNSFGEVGNGQEFVNKYNYPGFPGYGWDLVDYENPTGLPVQIGKGIKWKHIFSNDWFCFYKYAQDENDSIYSWGRNKSLDLGNGKWGGYNTDEYHPNSLDVLQPTMVHPLTTLFQQYGWVAPTISAGPNQNITGTTAHLTGTAQPLLLIADNPAPAVNGIDTAGYHVVAWQWTKVSGNGGTIVSPNASTTSVTGLSTGTYIFQLVTTDNNTGTLMARDTVIVNSAAGTPVASAGSDQTITLPVNSVILTGSGSETGGTIASYAWTYVSGPAGYAISAPGTAQTSVTGLVQGVYVFQLTVTDANGVTATSTVQVTVNPAVVTSSPPVANAGSDQTITLPTNTVTLTGSGSETGGTIMSYAWTEVSGPSTPTFGTNYEAQTSVTGLVQGTYTFQLTVTDANGVKATSTVEVTVNAAPVVPGTPSADAGSDQTITLPTNSTTLTGSGSVTNGTIVSYAWTEVSGPSTPTFGSAGQSTTTVGGLVQGVYKFQLKVTDNVGVTATDVVTVTVNPAVSVPGTPSANAGTDQTITLPVNSVTLTGSGSETGGTIASYAWTEVSGPSTPTFGSADQSQTTAGGLIAGVYRFELTVTDANGVTASATVLVTVDPASTPVILPPVAIAGPNQTTSDTSGVQLNGSASYDSGGTIVSYSWVQISGAGGVTIVNSNTATPTLDGLTPGVYVFQLTVTNNDGATASATVTITVVAGSTSTDSTSSPVAKVGQDTTVSYPIGNNAILNGSASYDLGGTITGYSWTEISGPISSPIIDSSSAVANVSGLAAGNYVYQLTVTDNRGLTSSATMTVSVVDDERTKDSVYFAMYPNPVPAGQSVTIQGSSSYTGPVTFNIMDISGRAISKVVTDKESQTFTQTLYLPMLSKGVYIVLIQFSPKTKPTSLKLVVD